MFNTQSEPATPRRRGGQPNNTNALKHGYYARQLPIELSQELQDHQFDGLEEEKLVIRYFIASVFRLGAGCDDLQQNLEFLRVVSLAVTTLTRIVRAEKYAGFLAQKTAAEELEQKIAELSLKYDQYYQDRYPDQDPIRSELFSENSATAVSATETTATDPLAIEPSSPAAYNPGTDIFDALQASTIRSDSFPNPLISQSSNPLPSPIRSDSFPYPSIPQPPAPPTFTADPFCIGIAKRAKPQFFQVDNSYDRF